MQKTKILIIIAIIISVSSACGRKGDPIVPRLSPPAPVANIKGFTKDSSAILNWEMPTKNMDGTKLKDLSKFAILRADIRDRETGGCGCAFVKIAVIDIQKPEPAAIKENSVIFIDKGDDLFPAGLTYKIPYSYKIIVEAKSGLLSPESEEIILTPTKPPNPPSGFKASVQNETVLLKWEPSKGDVKGYNIYRSKIKGSYPDTAVNKELIKAREGAFADIGLVPGTYFYIIRAADTVNPPHNEGPDSKEIEIRITK
ncbi:MAG: fibronectin type III domain-containing protein [Nitrospirae bacterium]|nr:fibronectin type III domain-containing protein [Nitrospirota bacterium]